MSGPLHVNPTIPGTGVALARGVRCGVAALTGTIQAGQPPADAVPATLARKVAVLPFNNISGADEDQWIGSGMAETLASDLPRMYGVKVLAREVFSLVQFGGTVAGVDVAAEEAALRICRALDARWLIAGGYQRLGDRVRITARLRVVESGAVAETVSLGTARSGVPADGEVLPDRSPGPSDRRRRGVPASTGLEPRFADGPQAVRVPRGGRGAGSRCDAPADRTSEEADRRSRTLRGPRACLSLLWSA